MMREVAMYGVAAAVMGGGGYYFVSEVVADVHEHDLSRIGKGVPTVVQVHDPDCPSCRSLMREARAAMEAFGPDELQYVIANLQTPEGQELASRHGVGKVTLLLMDADGRRRATLPGEASSAVLLPDFRRHAKRYASQVTN